MEPELLWIAKITGAADVQRGERVQSLWGGYGELFRVHLTGTARATAIVKWVKPPARSRATSTAISHRRKCRSYDVETAWYRKFAPRCDDASRVPVLIDSRVSRDEWLILLEDLDAAGFPERRQRLGAGDIDRCLVWLAAFHARFLGVAPNGLWKSGTYWHLATRPDELAAIEDRALREAAPILDRKLETCTHRTLVHGDAKVANFCFADDARGVAAVDFQYVGGGCGMKDVAYFLSSCSRRGAEVVEERFLDAYFGHLRDAIARRSDADVDFGALESEWRALYPIAYADFCRFLAGWAKDYWKQDEYGQSVTRRVLRTLS